MAEPAQLGGGFFSDAKAFLKKGLGVGEKISAAFSSEAGTAAKNMLQQGLNASGHGNPLSRPLYPGEKHGVVLSGRNIGSSYNFAGPGTHLQERLARGDQPINDFDRAALQHDIGYSNAASAKDVRDADIAFVKSAARSHDDPRMAKLALAAFKAKMLAEDAKVLDASKWADRLKTEQIGKGLRKEAHRLARSARKPRRVRLAVYS